MIDPRNIYSHFEVQIDADSFESYLAVIQKKTIFKSDCSFEKTTIDSIPVKALLLNSIITIYISEYTKDLYNEMAKAHIDKISIEEALNPDSIDKKILKIRPNPVAITQEVRRTDVLPQFTGSFDDKMLKICPTRTATSYFSEALNFGIDTTHKKETAYETIVFDGLRELRMVDPKIKNLVSFDLEQKSKAIS